MKNKRFILIFAIAMVVLMSIMTLAGCGDEDEYELKKDNIFKGEQGLPGADGKSAYELAVEKGYKGTLNQWLKSIEGKDGIDGVSVVNAYVNADIHLILVLSNSTEIDAGYVGVSVTSPSIKNTYTVTFLDWDGKVLKVEIVEEGKDATAPDNPNREGYRFSGWDKMFENVNANIEVLALYEKTEGAYLSGDNQIVNKGETISIPIELLNCDRGIKTFAIDISVNSSEITVVDGEWSSDFNYDISSFNIEKYQGVATLIKESIVNGNIFNAELHISDSIVSGTYMVSVSLKITFYDEEENEIEFPCKAIDILIDVK